MIDIEGTKVTFAYLGIDPGITGALAAIFCLETGQRIVQTYDAPVASVPVGKKMRHAPDIRRMCVLMDDVSVSGATFAVIEWAQAFPEQGVASVFSYGEGYGIWQGILAANSIPFERVRSQRWKKLIFAGRASSNKNQSRLTAMELFPEVDLGKRKDQGRAEALLLAEYARRTYNH